MARKNPKQDALWQLENDIVTGTLKPGDRLDEETLAARFSVSRTPIREILVRLSTMGMIELRGRRGAIVAEIGLRQLLEMFEVMGELEGLCGRLAANRATPEEIDAIETTHLACKEAVDAHDPGLYYRLNVKFHEAIYRASNNTYLAESTLSLRNRLAPYRRLQLHKIGRVEKSFDEHQKILTAIQERNGTLAETLLKSHVTTQGQTFSDFVATLPVKA